MAYLDQAVNFGKCTVSTGYNASATSIVLASSEGAKLPSFPGKPFNCVWYNNTDYADPCDDPNKEIIRVPARTGDTLSGILRGQEGTSAATHNIPGKVYKLLLCITAKMLTDIDNKLGPAQLFDVMSASFGAAGDGTTDDTAAIQAALDAAAVSGGTVFIPTGTFRIEGHLFYKSLFALKLCGAGFSSKLIWVPPAHVSYSISGATNASPIKITTTASHGFATGDWLIIEGVAGNTAANGVFPITWVSATEFTLDGSVGNSAYTSGGTATKIKEYAFIGITGTGNANAYHCQGAQIRDLYFDFGGSRAAGWAEYNRGLNLFNTDNIEICSCFLKGARGEMIGLGNFGLPDTPGNQASIHENILTDFAQDGVNPNVFNAVVCRNIFTAGDTGIEAGRASFTGSDNIFDDMEGCAVKIASCVGFNVRGNRMNNCLNDGTGLSSCVGVIYVMEQGGGTVCSDGVIDGNNIINPTRHTFQAGIVVASYNIHPLRIQVCCNVIYGPQQGIYVTNAEYISVFGNFVYPNGGSTGIAVDAGTTYCGIMDNTVLGTWTSAPIYLNAGTNNYQQNNKIA